MMIIAVASCWAPGGQPGPGLESCLVGRCGQGHQCASPVAPAGGGTWKLDSQERLAALAWKNPSMSFTYAGSSLPALVPGDAGLGITLPHSGTQLFAVRLREREPVFQALCPIELHVQFALVVAGGHMS